MSILHSTVGKTISYLRQNAGMTQQQLASALSVSHQAVSKWENGESLPDLGSLLEMSRIFGVTLDQLIHGDIPGMNNETASFNPTDVFAGFAEKAAKAAQQFGETIANGVSKVISSTESIVNDICADDDDGCEEITLSDEEASENPTMSIGSLIALAPFMSRDKLSKELVRCTDEISLAQLRAIAPYVSGDTLEILLERCNDSIDNEALLALAPFLKKEQLFRLITESPDGITLEKLRSFAPFLKRGMVDTLVESINKAKATINTDKICKQAADAFESIRSKVSTAINSVITDNDTGAASEETASGEPEAPEVIAKPLPAERRLEPSELKDKIARAALTAGSWAWLEAHVNEIGDKELVFDIAKTAAQDSERVALFKAAFDLIDEDSKNRLFDELLESGRLDIAASIIDFADSNAADKLLAALLSSDSLSGADLELVKTVSPHASNEALSNAVHRAIGSNNWQLIDILTPFI